MRAIAGGLFLFALILGIQGRERHSARASIAPRRPPRALIADDADHDGLPDALEAALATRFAPIVILDAHEANRPASIGWLLARIGRTDPGTSGFPAWLRPGSPDPRDWVTYVHVYPRTDGFINVQYWFFYPYNDGPLFFDHDADWEHITVEVDPSGEPRGVAFAQHGNNHPGVFRAWPIARKVGEHPVVLSARGTHASYPDQSSLNWFEHVSACTAVAGCADPIWRTWDAGGLVNVGERGAQLEAGGFRQALAYAGRWGGAGEFLRSRPAPRGPLHQRGFVIDGFN